jgi:hypothetical protein
MHNSSSFSLKGISLLFKQYLIHNGKLMLISITGVIAGLFVVLYSIQRYTLFDTWTHKNFITVFVPLFMILAVLYAGSAFPGLRSRDRAIKYLTLPVSTKEKFLFELVTRIALFVILMPTLFWAIFYLEGQLVALINPNFTFQSFSYLDGFNGPTQYQNNLIMTFVASHGLLFLTFPFFGATVFMKNQIIKTIALAFGILIVFFIVFNFNNFLEAIIKQYMLEFTCFIIALNFTLVVLAYFRLKNKQVR